MKSLLLAVMFATGCACLFGDCPPKPPKAAYPEIVCRRLRETEPLGTHVECDHLADRDCHLYCWNLNEPERDPKEWCSWCRGACRDGGGEPATCDSRTGSCACNVPAEAQP